MEAEAPEHWTLALGAAREAVNRHTDETLLDSLDRFRGYATAGESLLWLAILEESLWPPKGTEERRCYERRRAEDGRGRVAQGLRYLRNRLVHEQVVSVEESQLDGLMFPLKFPLRFDRWIFRWRAGLPAPTPRHRASDRYAAEEFAVYEASLAGQPTHHTLELALLWVELEIDRRGFAERDDGWRIQSMGLDSLPPLH